jgi:glycosyltransferase involved in cell wall biosynthesis
MKNRSNNIAVFNEFFIKKEDVFIKDQIQNLTNYNPQIFCRKNNQELDHIEIHSLEKSTFKTNFPSSLSFSLSSFTNVFSNIFKTENFRLIHAHYGQNGLNAIPYAKEFSIPLVVSLYGSDVVPLLKLEPYNNEFAKYFNEKENLFENTSLFIAQTPELKELFIESGGPEEKVVVSHCGIELSDFTYCEDKFDDFTIVAKGNLIESCGFKFAIQAFAQIIKKGYRSRLLIVGTGKLLNSLKSLVNKLNISPFVNFMGDIPYSDYLNILKKSHLLISPSIVTSSLYRESVCRIPMEASAMYLPVLATWHGGHHYIIEDDETGYLVPERDVDALTDRLLILIQNPQLCMEMGLSARAKMEFEFNVKKTSQKIERFFSKVIAS